MSDVKSNEEQIAYWNGRAGASWTDLADRTDAMLAPADDALLDAARLGEGERVLDVGCGCGATSLRAVKQVAPAGAIVGVDVSEPMLGRARERASGHPEISFRLEDAATAKFDAPFDIAISRFGVMFFEDPVAAFTNLRAALVGGSGRLAFVCWQHPLKNEWVTVPMEAARPFIPEVAAPAPGAPGPFAFADEARVQQILGAAGFVDVSVTPHVSPLEMARDAQDLLVQLSRIGPLSRALAELPRETGQRALEAARDAVVAKAQAQAKGDRLELDGAYWVVTARRG